MENKNIMVDATVTEFPTIPSYSELETRITKMNSIIQSGTLDGKELAHKYLKACNSTCDEEGLKAAIERLCSMGEAEAFEAYLANNTYTYPYAKKNTKTGLYEVATSSSKIIPFEPLENAYFLANGRFLTAHKYYNTFVTLVAYCADRVWLEANDSTRDEINLDAHALARLADLREQDPDTWGTFSKTKFAKQFDAMLAALLPTGYTLPFNIRNSDRKYFMDAIHSASGGSYDMKNTGFIYKTLFEVLRYAKENHHYAIRSNITGVTVTGIDKDGNKVQKLSRADKKRVKEENKEAREAAKAAKAAEKAAKQAAKKAEKPVEETAAPTEEKAA